LSVTTKLLRNKMGLGEKFLLQGNESGETKVEMNSLLLAGKVAEEGV